MPIQNVVEAYGSNIIGSHIEAGSSSSGHTILNSSGTALPQQPNLQFTGNVTLSNGTNKTVVEIEGGGHTIVNPSGTEKPQRSKLQFVGDGVTVVDSSSNDRTVVTINNSVEAILSQGTLGQFLTSDGNGGCTWTTVPAADNVGF